MRDQLPTLVGAVRMSALLGIPRETLYELALAGDLDGAYKIGKRWRFDPVRVLGSLEVDRKQDVNE